MSDPDRRRDIERGVFAAAMKVLGVVVLVGLAVLLLVRQQQESQEKAEDFADCVVLYGGDACR